MLEIETLDDLKSLIGTYENIRMEFKSSLLFYDQKTGKPKRNEFINSLSKHISGFANTEGGYLIIGLKTDKKEHEPDKAIALDDGISFKDFSPEGIQRTLEASISPPLLSLRFIPIESESPSNYY